MMMIMGEGKGTGKCFFIRLNFSSTLAKLRCSCYQLKVFEIFFEIFQFLKLKEIEKNLMNWTFHALFGLCFEEKTAKTKEFSNFQPWLPLFIFLSFFSFHFHFELNFQALIMNHQMIFDSGSWRFCFDFQVSSASSLKAFQRLEIAHNYENLNDVNFMLDNNSLGKYLQQLTIHRSTIFYCIKHNHNRSIKIND